MIKYHALSAKRLKRVHTWLISYLKYFLNILDNGKGGIRNIFQTETKNPLLYFVGKKVISIKTLNTKDTNWLVNKIHSSFVIKNEESKTKVTSASRVYFKEIKHPSPIIKCIHSGVGARPEKCSKNFKRYYFFQNVFLQILICEKNKLKFKMGKIRLFFVLFWLYHK